MAHNKRNHLSELTTNDISRSPTKKSQKINSEQSKKTPTKKIQMPDNFFTKIVSKAGITLNTHGNEIEYESVAFKKKLEELFQDCDHTAETINIFGNSFEECIENDKFFVSAMLPTEMSIDMNTSEISSSQISSTQDSLIKMLLQVDIIQPMIIDALLKKLPLYIENENLKIKHSSFAHEKNSTGIVMVPRLILNNLRWLNSIVNSSEVASKLIDMASIMQSGVACDIIAFIHNFLSDDADHETVAMRLCDLLNGGPENITSSVFDALSNLILDEEVTNNVQDVAISYLSSAELFDISVIVKFLLKNCPNIKSATKVIGLLRPQLDFSVLMASGGNLSKENVLSETKLIADTIFAEMQFQSCVATAWIFSLEKLSCLDMTFGDVICMLLLCDVSHSLIQQNSFNLVQSRFRHGTFPTHFLPDIFQTCSHALASHYKALCKLAQSLVWHSDPTLKQSGAKFYELILVHMDKFCKEEAIGYVIGHISSISVQSATVVDTALGVLCNVAKSHPEVLVPYCNYLRNALDRMEAMTLSQVRKSYTILSWLAYSSNEGSLGMRDEIHMILQKQLSSASDRYRHIGKIGSVSTLLAMSNINSTDKSSSNQHKEIKSLLQNIDYLLSNDVQQWSLFYDEIYIEFSTNQNVPLFLLKLVNHDASIKFQNKFVKEISNMESSKSEMLDLSLQFGIAEASDIYVSITPTLFDSRHSASYLCSLFLSISWMEKQIQNSFDEIDALISCPMYLFDPKYRDRLIFKELSIEKQFVVLDSLFAMINWFRELISVFCLDEDSEIQCKVIKRLNNISEIQNILEKLLFLAPPSYTPPNMDSSCVNFSSLLNNSLSQPSFSANVTQKPGKSQADISSTACSIKPTNPKKEKKKNVANKSNVLMTKENFCELTKDVFMLLRYKLKTLKDEKENQENDEIMDTDQSEISESYLKPRSLLYLLEDLYLKLKHRLSILKLPAGFGHQKSTSNFGFERFDQFPILEVIKMGVHLLPDICKHLETTFLYLQDPDNSQNADESLISNASGIYILENETMTKCCSFLLEIILQILSWNGLQNLESEENSDLLLTILQSFSKRIKDNVSNSDQVALLSSFRYFFANSKTIHSGSVGLTLVKILMILCEFAIPETAQHTWMAKKISNLANHFLIKDWAGEWSMMNTQKQNFLISGLFGAYLNYSEEPIGSIEFFLKHGLGTLLEEVPDSEDTEERISYPCLSKSNFYVFYKSINESITKEMLKIPATKLSMNDDTLVDILLNWGSIVEIWVRVIKLVKTFTSRLLLGPALKNARCILENFLKYGMPVCEMAFTNHRDDVINMFKTLQMVTRNLQYVTHHSKTLKDSALINHVSAVKLSLEMLVYKVKTMLVLHNCHEAFWLGRLKNRNLQGEVLLSQVAKPNSEDEEEEQEEDILSNLTKNSNQSFSECF